MNVDYRTMLDNQNKVFEKKLQQIFLNLGFEGDFENAKDIKKFILENSLEVDTTSDIFGFKYKVINNKTNEVLAGFRVVNKLIEDKENLKFTMVSRIEDI